MPVDLLIDLMVSHVQIMRSHGPMDPGREGANSSSGHIQWLNNHKPEQVYVHNLISDFNVQTLGNVVERNP